MSKRRSTTSTSSLISFFSRKYLLLVLIFFSAFFVRFESLTEMGRTWDESYSVTGYEYARLIFSNNFSSPYWYTQADHPPLVRYIYGLASYLDPSTKIVDGKVTLSYELFWPRFISLLAGCLSAVLVGLIGLKYFSRYVGITSGIIFAFIPFFVGLSQVATLESFVMLFFTLAIYFFLDYLSTGSGRSLILTGVVVGLNMLTKQSSLIILPLLFLLYFMWSFSFKKRSLKNFFGASIRTFLIIISVSLASFFVLWPMPFFHLNEVWRVQDKMWIKDVKLPPPEVFFGRLMLVPLPYYPVMFIVTTPIVLLVLGLIGVLKIDKIKSLVAFSILIWFLFPFLQSFYAFKQHGVRYIIEIYAPFALLCGIGLDYLNNIISIRKRWVSAFTLFFVIIYLLLSLLKVRPFYLDYFSEVVGGNKYVYSHKLFQMGWWGQGIGPAFYYISNMEKKTVTVAVNGPQPASVAPDLYNTKLVYYDKKRPSDYIVVPYFDVVRLGFPEQELSSRYKQVHVVMAGDAPLVKIYKRVK